MIRLFISYYLDRHPERQKELDYCLETNLNLECINEVHVVLEYPIESNLLTHPKIKIHHVKSRPSYSTFFDIINSINPNICDVSIIANSDIYFDETIIKGKDCDQKNVYALSRWDVRKGQAKHFNSWDSQDTWIFKGRIKPVYNSDFQMGSPGCDNAIADRLFRSGYHISNPSKSIKTYHLHETGVHNYNTSERISEPYKFLTPI